MNRIYLDNSATSYPKAPGVSDAVKNFMDNVGANVNRSGYSGDLMAEEILFDTRERLGKLFNYNCSENIAFTMNITYGLNILMKGLLKKGDHCIVSSMEHNAVMRPLMQLSGEGVSFSRVPCDIRGRLNPEDIRPYIRPNTKAVVMLHASNVCGTVLPLSDVGDICKEKGIKLIIDAAQTAGAMNIDFEALKADAIAFTGHKSLLAPQGIGGFIIRKEMARQIDPLIGGGTGSYSEHETQPSYMPDKFEAGTLNLPGIAGLNVALKFIQKTGINAIREKEMNLTEVLLQGLSAIKNVHIAGLESSEERMPTVSVDCKGYDNAEIAYSLDRHYGIQTRCGLHCAPSAHKTLGTFPQGTIRFSLSCFNTKDEIDYTVLSLNKILRERF